MILTVFRSASCQFWLRWVFSMNEVSKWTSIYADSRKSFKSWIFTIFSNLWLIFCKKSRIWCCKKWFHVFCKKASKPRLTQKFLKSGKMKAIGCRDHVCTTPSHFFAFLYIFQIIFKSQKAIFDQKSSKTAIFQRVFDEQKRTFSRRKT